MMGTRLGSTSCKTIQLRRSSRGERLVRSQFRELGINWLQAARAEESCLEAATRNLLSWRAANGDYLLLVGHLSTAQGGRTQRIDRWATSSNGAST